MDLCLPLAQTKRRQSKAIPWHMKNYYIWRTCLIFESVLPLLLLKAESCSWLQKASDFTIISAADSGLCVSIFWNEVIILEVAQWRLTKWYYSSWNWRKCSVVKQKKEKLRKLNLHPCCSRYCVNMQPTFLSQLHGFVKLSVESTFIKYKKAHLLNRLNEPFFLNLYQYCIEWYAEWYNFTPKKYLAGYNL